MDAITMDGIVSELRERFLGRHIRRVRLLGSDTLLIEPGGGERVLLSARRSAPGLYVVDREAWQGLPPSPEPGRRAAHLHLRLRAAIQGARVAGLERVPGERTLVLRVGSAALALRVSGPAPAISLAVENALVGTLGGGPPAWPPPSPHPENAWHHLAPEAFASAVEALRREGRSLRRACLAACPELGPVLARELDGGAASFQALCRRLAHPTPTLTTIRRLEDCDDAELVPRDAVLLTPLPLATGVSRQPGSWAAASALFLRARWRGDAFAHRLEQGLREARTRRARFERLVRALDRDAAGAPESAPLRRQATALLAHARDIPAGTPRIEVPDPEDEDVLLSIPLDPSRSAVENAEALFRRARRGDRSRAQLQQRRADAQAALAAARRAEGELEAARDLSDLDAILPSEREAERGRASGPPRFLSSRGLTILIGRGARENHRVTFEMARPEDYWLHVRDRPGAHVVVRDPESRATASDLREAAELAAYFSDARSEPAVDVHVARRKHLRPVRGAPGRVVIGHSETLRAAPRDPEGRLRRR